MATTCHTCKRPRPDDDLHRLHGLDAHSRTLPDGVRLCSDCLDQRETRSWQARDPGMQRLVEALEDRDEPKHGRYAFLAEGSDAVHLLRLRDGWVERAAHGEVEASGAGSGPAA